MLASTRRVLLVEPDGDVRSSLVFALEFHHWQVIQVGQIAIAKHLFIQCPPHVAIINQHLPDGSGFKLATWIWEQRQLLPIVFISADFGAGPNLRTRNPEEYWVQMLAMPFSASELITALLTVLAGPR